MKYFKSIRGYYYKEYKNGKKVRISRKVYEKKLKTLKGGAPTYKNIFSIFIQNSRIFKNIQEMINKSCPFLSLTYVTTEDKNEIGKIQCSVLQKFKTHSVYISLLNISLFWQKISHVKYYLKNEAQTLSYYIYNCTKFFIN